jgi:hypothetical protein
MAYTINKTNGTILATVPDGQVDQFSSDLTLIGKNYESFGAYLNENFIKLLENFSNNVKPEQPIKGQLWFDSTETKLKVYTGLDFVPVSSASISNTPPDGLGIGDLWYNNIDKQLYFNSGTALVLLGPLYSASQRKSGLEVDSILDTLNQTKIVTYFYSGGILLGIFASDTFTPRIAIPGFSGIIQPGFNAGSVEGMKFNVTATNSEKLGNILAENYIRTDQSGIINGSLVLASDAGITVGAGNQGVFDVRNGNVTIENQLSGKNLQFNVRNTGAAETALEIDSTSREVRIFLNSISSKLLVGGNLTVNGNLLVNGTTTSINESILEIENKNIILSDTSTPSDVLASGGGIILRGTTDHTLTWLSSAKAWTSSEHVNLESSTSVPSPDYKINGVTVISSNSLGTGITSIPGVTNFGKQTVLKVGPGSAIEPERMRLENNRISTVSNDYNLELEAHGSGNISLIGNPRIIGLSTPVDNKDAATKEYVDNIVETRNLSFSIDISDNITNTEIASILQQLAPPTEHRAGILARILCTKSVITTNNIDINPSVEITKGVFNQSTGTAEAVTDISFTPVTTTPAGVSVTREIKTFEIIGGIWIFIA